MSNTIGKLFRGEELTDDELKQLYKVAMPGAVAALSILSVNKGLIGALSSIAANTGAYLPDLTPKVSVVPKVQPGAGNVLARRVREMRAENQKALAIIERGEALVNRIGFMAAEADAVKPKSDTVH